jgi:CheY-like chemotaxis protein
MCNRRILVIDDEQGFADNIGFYLGSAGAHVVSVAYSGEQALGAAETFAPECIVADYNLPGIDGIETIVRLREMHPAARCVLMTAHPSAAMFAAAREHGVRDVLIKPFPLPSLRPHVCGTQSTSEIVDEIR